MLRNYLTIALRNLIKHRLYSAINIVGLAIGLATAILILLFVRNETTYDGFFTDKDRIYQVATEIRVPGRQPQRTSASAFHWGPAYVAEHEEARDFTRVFGSRAIAGTGDARYYQDYVLVDANFLDVFDFALLAGDRATALSDPMSVVLTEELALKFFGVKDAVGRILTLDGRHDFRVTAVLRKLPPNTHLDLDVLIPISSPLTPEFLRGAENWGNTCCLTYIRFKEGVDIGRLVADAPAWVKRRAPDLQTPQGPIPIGEFMVPDMRPLTGIHTDPIGDEPNAGVSMTEVYTLIAIAVLVLLIASINFMNLATARATQRAREVSVRKVVGAGQGQIIAQFLGESVLIAMIGLFLALALAELALPAFSSFIGKDLAIRYADVELMGSLLGLAIFVGVVGGSYPAFFLSRFEPARVLKGETGGGGGSGRLRAALVVVQFSISIALIVATAVVYRQFDFAQNKKLGFDKENVVVVGYWNTPGVVEHRDSFMETLRQDQSIVSVGLGSFVPGDPWESNTLVRRPGDESGREVVMRRDSIGYDYFQTLGMTIVAGRDFDRARGTDQIVRPDWQLRGEPPPAGTTEMVIPASAVVNRTAALRMGFETPEAAIGQELTVLDSEVSTVRATIIGVVEDFHFRSIHDEIQPSIYLMDPPALHAMAIRIRAGMTADALKLLDRTWASMIQDRPIERVFLDSIIQRLYEREQKIAQAFASFSCLAVLIACLGLFGLANFTAARRTKEIGLRKVMGASVSDIVRLLVWQFSKPVLLANLIAWPVAWFGTSRWLEGFAYRVDVSPLLFLFAGATALAIAWITVGLHAARVAQAKPMMALRYE